MSLLEKLRELVASEEAPEHELTTPPLEEELQEIDDQDIIEVEEVEEGEEIDETPDYIYCTDEESSLLKEAVLEIKNHKATLSELVIQFEHQKQLILEKIESTQDEMRIFAKDLSDKYKVADSGAEYILHVPDEPDSKVVFVVKS